MGLRLQFVPSNTNHSSFMTTLTLKSYQQSALDALATYARAARVKGPALAFAEHAGRAYNADAFGPDVPCVCLRIPTGGGKTVLAAHAVPLLAAEWRGTRCARGRVVGAQRHHSHPDP